MQENLKRDIGTFGMAFAVINITVGTGIFVLPALAAETLGAAAIVCYLVCGLLIFLIALCFAEVGSKVTVSGGTYVYIEKAFGPFAGFLANNIFLFGCCVLGDAAVASALSTTLGFFWPVIDSPALRPLFFFLVFGGLALVNIRGTKNGMRLIVFSTFAKLIPLLMLVVFGTGHIAAANLHWKGPIGLHDIGAGTLILFFAFLGIETAVNNGGEFRNPARTVPLGILSGLSFVLILYVLIQLISQGVLGDQLLVHKDAPLVAVSKSIFGRAGIGLMVIATAFSMLGNLTGEILGNSRILFAGARDGIFPKILASIQPKFITPHLSILTYAGLGFVFAVFGAFKQLIILSSASTLLIYLGVVLAAIRFRYKKASIEERGFTIPGGITVPVIATVIIIWVLSNLSMREMTGMCICLAIFSVIYFFMQWFRKNRIRKPGQ